MGKRGNSGRRGNGEGSILFIEGRGWRGSVALGVDSNGKPIRKYILRQTRGEVLAAIKDLVKKKETNQPITSTKRTVGTFIPGWLKDIEPLVSPSTYRGYEQTARMYIIPMLGKIPLDQLNGQHVQRFLNKVASLPADTRFKNHGALSRKESSVGMLSPASVQRINATLKTALSTAITYGFINTNAAKNAKPPKQVKYTAKPLTEVDGLKLLEAVVGDRYEAITTCGMTLGLRRGEVAGLKWSAINFITGRMEITHQLQRVKGDGVVLRELKSKSSRRSIQLPPFCVEALTRRAAIQERERELAGTKWKDTGFIFTGKDGGPIMTEKVTTEHTAALIRAKLPHVRFHDLRHTAATLLLAKKVPMKMVQEILGHSSFQITMELYGHVVAEQRGAATQAMEDMFGTGRSTPVLRTDAPTDAPRKQQTIQ